jgi:hypothetical protein
MYKLAPLAFYFNNPEGVQSGVYRLADNAFIPFAEDNTDYQAYLAWVAEGNEPEPADEGTQ